MAEGRGGRLDGGMGVDLLLERSSSSTFGCFAAIGFVQASCVAKDCCAEGDHAEGLDTGMFFVCVVLLLRNVVATTGTLPVSTVGLIRCGISFVDEKLKLGHSSVPRMLCCDVDESLDCEPLPAEQATCSFPDSPLCTQLPVCLPSVGIAQRATFFSGQAASAFCRDSLPEGLKLGHPSTSTMCCFDRLR